MKCDKCNLDLISQEERERKVCDSCDTLDTSKAEMSWDAQLPQPVRDIPPP
ncbi:hypothetical protein HYW73_01555 [Candidatus Nomurabacteria bacterium]|nr:hypothetical protein [Candidatus Nomurabacteria bacterium]